MGGVGLVGWEGAGVGWMEGEGGIGWGVAATFLGAGRMWRFEGRAGLALAGGAIVRVGAGAWGIAAARGAP